MNEKGLQELRRRLKNTKQENRRLQQRLSTTSHKTAQETIADLFEENKKLVDLVQMQYERNKSSRTKSYTDYEKAIAYTIWYNSGRRGYE